MKKLKFLLPLLLAMAMAVSIPFAAACKKADFNSGELISISLDTSSARQNFLRGEAFTSSGLVVNATVKSNKKTLVQNVAESAVINSSAYNNTKTGEYPIKVSYTHQGKTLEAEYEVSVVESIFEGLQVTFGDGSDTKLIELSADLSKASIDPENIVVQRGDAFGVIGEPLSASEYRLELWKENQKVEDSHLVDGVYTNLPGGVYQLWAYAPSLEINDYELKGFALVIVADKVTGLAVDTNGHHTQTLGLDVISSTWTYTVTYISGATANVSNTAVTFADFDTKTAGTNKTATVKYSEVNAAGVTSQASCTVTYTILDSSLANLPKQEFIIQSVTDAANKFATVTPTDSDGVGGVIEDNALFTLTTQGAMQYATTTSNQITDVTLMDGSKVESFDDGLVQSTSTTAGEETASITFTAKSDITLKAFMTLSDSKFSSNRTGTLIATINHKDGSVSRTEINKVGEARKTLSNISFDLFEGDVLVITIRNDHASSTAFMWLFGAEATAYKEVNGGN